MSSPVPFRVDRLPFTIRAVILPACADSHGPPDDADTQRVRRVGGDLAEPRPPHHSGDLLRRVCPPTPRSPPPCGRRRRPAPAGTSSLPRAGIPGRPPAPPGPGGARPAQQFPAVGFGVGVKNLGDPDDVVRSAERVLEEVPLQQPDPCLHPLFPKDLPGDPERFRRVEDGDLRAGIRLRPCDGIGTRPAPEVEEAVPAAERDLPGHGRRPLAGVLLHLPGRRHLTGFHFF